MSVAIVIPNLNYGHLLGEALDSCFAQTLKPSEIIVVDGGSQDNSYVVARRPGVCWRVEPLPGMGRAKNVGIADTTSDLILTLDSDDRIAPDFLEKACPLMEDPRVGIVATGLQRFGSENGIQMPALPAGVKEFLTGNRIFTTSLFRKRCWEEVGGFDQRPGVIYEDWDFWLRIVAVGWRVAAVMEPLFCYRRHPQANSTVNVNRMIDSGMKAAIRAKHADLYAFYRL